MQELLSNLEEALRPVSEHAHGPSKETAPQVLRVADAQGSGAPVASAATEEASTGNVPSATSEPPDVQEQPATVDAAACTPPEDAGTESEKPQEAGDTAPAMRNVVDRGSCAERESGKPGTAADASHTETAADTNGALPESASVYRGTISLETAQSERSSHLQTSCIQYPMPMDSLLRTLASMMLMSPLL